MPSSIHQPSPSSAIDLLPTAPKSMASASIADADGENSWKDDDFLSFGNGGKNESKDDDGGGDDGPDEGVRQGLAFRQQGGGGHGQYQKQERHTGQQRQHQNQQQQSDRSSLVGPDPLPPWMNGTPHTRYDPSSRRPVPPLVLLHNEIVDFASLMEPRKDEIEEREEVVRRIKSLVTETFGKDKVSMSQR